MNFEKDYKKLVEQRFDFGTGITAFCSKKIQMKFNEFGEYFPYIDDISKLTDEEITKIRHTNLVLNNRNRNELAKNLFEHNPEIYFNKKIGYYSSLYIGYVKEGEYRKNGSSGGFTTWLLKEMLDKGLVDGVIHVHATENKNKLFEYRISRTMEEIIAGSKTKYYPVEMSEVLEIVKKTPGKYAIVGLPSFITELRLLGEIDPIINERIKYMVGLVCGHQKSSKFSDFLAWQCGIAPGNLEYIDFRKKIKDKPSSSYGIEVKGKKGTETVTFFKEMKDIYGGDWGKGFFKIKASDFTDDVMNELADITLGDAWLPEYTKDPNGNNIVVIRNSEINKLVKEAIKENRVKLDSTNTEKIIQSQSAHYRHTQEELPYRLYKKKKAHQWYPQKQISPSKDLPFIRKRIQDVREAIYIHVPIYFNQAVKKGQFTVFKNKMYLYDKLYILLYKALSIQKKLGYKK